MSMKRVEQAVRVHRLASLRGAKVMPERDGWSLLVAGREIEVKSMADAERLLLSMPVELPSSASVE